MPKTAIICNNAFYLCNFRSHLIEDFIARGEDVYALAPDYSPKYRQHIEGLGATTVDITMDGKGKNGVKDLGTIYNLTKTLRDIKPDTTFSYGIKPVIYGLIAARLAKVPRNYSLIAGLGIMYSGDEKQSVKEKLVSTTVDQLYRFSLRYANKIFFQNPDDIALFRKKNIIKDNQPVLVNGSGVDLEEYEASSLQKEPITFTLVARLIKEKGIYEFVEAARTIKRKMSSINLRFLLLGDIDANPNAISRNEAQKWDDEGIIEWPGHVDNIKEWLEKTSVFVLPTYYREGTPRSILEAMSMSRPVITTDMPGSRETVEEGGNGFLIQPKSVEELVSAMETFINHPELIEAFGKRSRKIAEEKYDVRKVNKKMLKYK